MKTMKSNKLGKGRFTAKAATAVIVGSVALGLTACSQTEAGYKNSAAISKADVLAAQKAWGDGIVAIGDVYEKVAITLPAPVSTSAACTPTANLKCCSSRRSPAISSSATASVVHCLTL